MKTLVWKVTFGSRRDGSLNLCSETVVAKTLLEAVKKAQARAKGLNAWPTDVELIVAVDGMTAHADKLQSARDAVVEAAKAVRRAQTDGSPLSVRWPTYTACDDAVDALLALESRTCPTCDGLGHAPTVVHRIPASELPPCPAGCHEGEKK